MNVIPVDSILIPLTAVLGLSLIVERILEIVKNILQRLLGSRQGRALPDLKDADAIIGQLQNKYQLGSAAQSAEEQAQKVAAERLKLKTQYEKEKDAGEKKELYEKLQALEQDKEWDERVPVWRVFVEAASDPDDGTTLRVFIIQLLGFAVGIILAHFSGVQLFNSFLNSLGQNTMPAWLDFLFTGLLIGGGSGPMHVLVKFVTDRKFTIPEEQSAAEVTKAPTENTTKATALITPKPALRPDDWVDITYNGGVDREALQDVHRRKNNPDLIIYHHTAMNSKSTFQDVVRVIKERKWLTGYNCVIQFDGSVHPFCRWDRYGSHAAGYNARSLGIAFNGNYETDPKVPFSNPDGRLGPTRPGEEQLKAGARVVALWTFLYNIPVDFDKSIIAHNKISTKTCPGNNFPYEELRNWIEHYKNTWEKSEEIMHQISAFKLKPYLYI